MIVGYTHLTLLILIEKNASWYVWTEITPTWMISSKSSLQLTDAKIFFRELETSFRICQTLVSEFIYRTLRVYRSHDRAMIWQPWKRLPGMAIQLSLVVRVVTSNKLPATLTSYSLYTPRNRAAVYKLTWHVFLSSWISNALKITMKFWPIWVSRCTCGEHFLVKCYRKVR